MISRKTEEASDEISKKLSTFSALREQDLKYLY